MPSEQIKTPVDQKRAPTASSSDPSHFDTAWASNPSSPARSTHPSYEHDRHFKEQRYHEDMWNGAMYSAAAGTGTAALIYAAHRRSAFWRSLTLPFKTFLVLAASTGTFFTYVDQASIRAARDLSLPRSISGPLAESSLDKTPRQVGGEPLHRQDKTLKHWIVEHRTPLVAGVWAGTLGGSMLYTWGRRDISTANKVINARLIAQVCALAGLGAAAALASTDPHPVQVDRHFERVMNKVPLAPGEGAITTKLYPVSEKAGSALENVGHVKRGE
ncbi:hypothetical protein HDV00_006674 [Rhizophlyctis rosea]|nr:hypothetical protein HDV00_006674 [Rhizophlyctis rosea]